MDSGDDASDQSAGSKASAASSRASSQMSRRAAEALPASVGEVTSFPQMVRMAPSLQRRAAAMSAAELVAVCAAAARVKFYEPALFGAVTAALRRHLARSSVNGRGLRTSELVVVLVSLAELNAYDREIFSTAARAFAGSGVVEGLDAAQRQQLLSSFKAVKHEGDEELVSHLVRKTKEERYEIAREEVFQRSLTRMYGDNQDLQGWAVDTERALLKRPRPQVTRERR